MGVSGNDGVRVDSHLLADGIDLSKHGRASAVIPATGGALVGRVRERRMMHGENYSTLIVTRLDALQLRGEEFELIVGNGWPLGRLPCLSLLGCALLCNS